MEGVNEIDEEGDGQDCFGVSGTSSRPRVVGERWPVTKFLRMIMVNFNCGQERDQVELTLRSGSRGQHDSSA
jgi:hypothetical protein